MRSPSFTAGSESFWRTAFPWVAGLIVCVELIMARQLPGRYFNHEVDRLLESIERDRHEPGVALLGDSVGNQLLGPFGVGKPNRFAALTSNQAVEMPGHYYTLKRHMRRRKAPHAVVFLGKDPFGFNLEQQLTENYVQRCFTRWNEILELTIEKRDPVFGLKMILYKLIPSHKYRLHLQAQLVGSANADIYTGVNSSPNPQSRPKKKRERGVFGLARKLVDRSRLRPISDEYLIRLVELLKRRNIKFYYVPAPLPETARATDSDFGRAAAGARELLRPYDNAYFMEDLQLVFPDERFVDGTHLDEEGLRMAHEKLDGFLWDVQSRKRPEYQAAVRSAGAPAAR